MHLQKANLEKLYLKRKLSSAEIARLLKCSPTGVDYWIKKFKIKKRTISDAIYTKHNPNGDPFTFNRPSNFQTWFLYGLGLGLYWGEGTKSNIGSVRLGNADPRLIKSFINFLLITFKIDKNKLRFGLQLFSDIDPKEALRYWQKYLKIKNSQFYKIIITPSTKQGTYKRKLKHGVLTLYFNNKKLRDLLCNLIENQVLMYYH